MPPNRFALAVASLAAYAAAPAIAQFTPREFSERQKRAESVERMPGAATYWSEGLMPLVGPSMHTAMLACLKTPDADRRTFTFLADVEVSGRLSRIDVYPRTNTSQCFAAKAADFTASPPPAALPRPFPIVIKQVLN